MTLRREPVTTENNLSSWHISNASDLTPKWFNKGVKAAQLAPTAINQQKFFIEYVGLRDVKMYKVNVKKAYSIVDYTQLDLGIVKLHFEIGTDFENFKWIEQ